MHLCKQCLRTRVHINHIKNNLIEIQPMEEELNIINDVILDYQYKIDNLENEKKNKIKEIENKLYYSKLKQNKIIEIKIKKNEINKKKVLKMNKELYINDINKIKKKYEEEIKLRKIKFKRDNRETINKFNFIHQKEYQIHIYKINELIKKYNEEIQNLEYDKKIDNISNIKKLNEIIYNAYNAYNDNYFNCININNILVNYYQNEYIKNNIMKKNLEDNYEEIIQKILQKRNDGLNLDIIKSNYENELMKMKEKYEKYERITEEKLSLLYKEMTIIYKINKNEESVRIFGNEFVNEHKTICKIIYDEKEYELKEIF